MSGPLHVSAERPQTASLKITTIAAHASKAATTSSATNGNHPVRVVQNVYEYERNTQISFYGGVERNGIKGSLSGLSSVVGIRQRLEAGPSSRSRFSICEESHS